MPDSRDVAQNPRPGRTWLSVRALMVLILLVAATLAWIEVGRRGSEFRRRALIHEALFELIETGRADFDLEEADLIPPIPAKKFARYLRPISPAEVEQRRRIVAWHRDLARKYREAMKASWLAIEPDPPRPE